MFVDEKWMERKYLEFNERFFGGGCPRRIRFKVNNLADTWGRAGCRFIISNGEVVPTDFVIYMSNSYDSPEFVKENTMIHEMIHIYDYSHYPERYYQYNRYKGKLVKARGYNAHGPWFEMMAQKINDISDYDIQRFIAEEERSVSVMSDKLKQKIDNKNAKGFVLGYAEFPSIRCPHLWFKTTTPENLRKIMTNQRDISYIEAYHVHGDLSEYGGCRDYIRGYTDDYTFFRNEILNRMIDSKLLIMQGEIRYGKKEENVVKGATNVSSVNDAESQKKTIKHFRFSTTNGNVFDVRNVTEDELINKLKERFPKWSETAILNAVKNQKYHLNEGVEMKEDVELNVLADGYNGVGKRINDTTALHIMI